MIGYRIKEIEENKKNDISIYLAIESFLTGENSIINDDVFFLWDIDKSIIIGRHQLLESEVNIDYAKSIGCKIYRRTSGGGAIFADENCFMFTFITKERDKNIVFRKYLGKIIDALQYLNLKVNFSGRNDLMFNEKKFSGNAIYYHNDYTILHGTFLYNSNLENLVKCLSPDDEKLISKGIKSVQERVINLKPYIMLTKKELMDYLLNTICDNIKELSCNDEILNLKNKFDSNDWIYYHNPPFTFHNKKRFDYGLIEVFISVNNNKVTSLNLAGDFFALRDLSTFTEGFKKINYSKIDFINYLNYNNINDFIVNANNTDFINLIFKETNY